jgi:hypothetical protein
LAASKGSLVLMVKPLIRTLEFKSVNLGLALAKKNGSTAADRAEYAKSLIEDAKRPSTY